MSIKNRVDKLISTPKTVKKLPYIFKMDELVLYKKGIEHILLKVYSVQGNHFVHSRSIKSKQRDEVYDIINCKIDGTPVAPFFIQLADEIYITNQVGGHRYVVGNIDYEPNAGYYAELGYVEHHELKKVKLLLVDIIEHIKF
jgi:hypothetical protein